MFEKFRFKDAFLGLWKYKFFLIAIFILTAIAVCTKHLKSNNEELKSNEYLTTASFSILPKFESEDNKSKITNRVEAANLLASSYVSVISSDVCTKYIYNGLLQKYSLDEILKLDSLSEYTAETLDFSALKPLIKVLKSSGSQLVINIYVEMCDKNLSMDIIDLYKDFISKEFISKASDIVQINYLGTVQQASDGKALDTIENSNITPKSSVSIKKQLILWEFLMLALAVIIIFTKVLFMPTINSKEDFAQYEIPVITEMSGFCGRKCNV